MTCWSFWCLPQSSTGGHFVWPLLFIGTIYWKLYRTLYTIQNWILCVTALHTTGRAVPRWHPRPQYKSRAQTPGHRPSCTALHCTALHWTALHCPTLICTAPHCTALSCTALHCTALHCTALHFTKLHSITHKSPYSLRLTPYLKQYSKRNSCLIGLPSRD